MLSAVLQEGTHGQCQSSLCCGQQARRSRLPGCPSCTGFWRLSDNLVKPAGWGWGVSEAGVLVWLMKLIRNVNTVILNRSQLLCGHQSFVAVAVHLGKAGRGFALVFFLLNASRLLGDSSPALPQTRSPIVARPQLICPWLLHVLVGF